MNLTEQELADILKNSDVKVQRQAKQPAAPNFSPLGELPAITICFDHLPYAELYPNRLRQTHWTVRSRWEKTAREEACTLAKTLLDGWAVPPKASVSYLFHVRNRRRRDIEGMVGACKPWIDGLVDAGVLRDDDCWSLTLAGAEVVLGEHEATEITIQKTRLAP